MRIEDLMINDFVYRKRSYNNELVLCKIIAINRKGCIVEFDNGSSWSGECIEDIVPIPITPEILEKNGYIFDAKETNKLKDIMPNTNMYKFPLGVGFYIEHNTIKNTYVLSDHGWIQMKYVHEFQHLLKLCGIDKQIIL